MDQLQVREDDYGKSHTNKCTSMMGHMVTRLYTRYIHTSSCAL